MIQIKKTYKILLALLVTFLIIGCSKSDLPEKEYEVCFYLKSQMLKGFKAMSKLNIEDSSGFKTRCFNYLSNDPPDYFKISEKYIDIPDILDFYREIDLYYFKNKNINGLKDSIFKTTFIDTMNINGFKLDLYEVRTKMDLISTVCIHSFYGLVLVESEMPLGSIELKNFENKELKYKVPISGELDSIFYKKYFLEAIPD